MTDTAIAAARHGEDRRMSADQNVMERCGIPARMHAGLARWIDHHIAPGHFLCAVLSNDLRGACACADHENAILLSVYMTYLSNYAPSACHGSIEKFQAWRKQS